MGAMGSFVVEWRHLEKGYQGVATEIKSSGGPFYRVDFTIKTRVTPVYLIQLKIDLDKKWIRFGGPELPGFDGAFMQKMGQAIESHPSFQTSFK